uniref:Tubulin alpha chain n=1 Tax=Agmasoma penaei TaxID=366552 RepID=A0A0A7R870_9MICR|nr:alpha-tubulin [Agmasoma penaei]
MRELVHIHIGQAGCQMGNAVWELYCLEHGINPDGTTNQDFKDINEPSSIFYRTEMNKFVPRAVYLDLEPSVINQVKGGKYKQLFHPESLVHGKEDAANNYARAHYTVGREMLDPAMDAIRRTMELCDNAVQGFTVFHSFGGGTGSGFTSLIMEQLKDKSKASKLEFAIYPSPKLGTSVVEPYNSLLTTHMTIDYSDCSFLVDNQAIFSMCKRLGITAPKYNDINRIVAQAVSSISASLRFRGDLNVDLTEFQTNLVPYPRIHFPICAISPMNPASKSSHEVNDVSSLVRNVYSRDNQLINCDIHSGAFISSCLLFRGDVTSHDANKALQNYRNAKSDSKRFNFVDWVPTGYKVGINSRGPSVVPGSQQAPSTRSVVALSNTTAISSAWKSLIKKYDNMYSKRAYVHWYVSEGMEESEFTEARDDMEQLVREYDMIESPQVQ